MQSSNKENNKEIKAKVNRYKTNPFIDEINIKTKSKRITVAKGRAIVDVETGYLDGWTDICQIVEVDEGQFIKLFTKDLANWFDLSKPGFRVFGALLCSLQKEAIGKDVIFFDFKNDFLKSFKISKSTFYRGIDELIEKKFLARHLSPSIYFINPLMFFNGNRARFIRDYRLKGDKDHISEYEPTKVRKMISEM